MGAGRFTTSTHRLAEIRPKIHVSTTSVRHFTLHRLQCNDQRDLSQIKWYDLWNKNWLTVLAHQVSLHFGSNFSRSEVSPFHSCNNYKKHNEKKHIYKKDNRNNYHMHTLAHKKLDLLMAVYDSLCILSPCSQAYNTHTTVKLSCKVIRWLTAGCSTQTFECGNCKTVMNIS